MRCSAMRDFTEYYATIDSVLVSVVTYMYTLSSRYLSAPFKSSSRSIRFINTTMQNFIVNLKDDASDADVADAKKSIESQGGTIKDVSF